MKPASGLTKGRREVTKVWLSYRWPIIGAAVVIVAAAAYFMMPSIGSVTSASRSNDGGSELAAHAAATWNRTVGSIEGAVAAADLATRVRDSGPESLDEDLAKLVANDANVIGARYVAVAESKTDRSAFPPIGYAVLDMVRKSEASGKVVPPAALFFGSENEQIAILQPLRAGEELVGHVLLALDGKVARTLIADSAVGAQYVEVQQPVAGEAPVPLAVAGDAGRRQGPPTWSHRIPGTTWTLKAWSGAVVARPTDSGGLPLMPILGGVLVLGLLGAGGFAWNKRRLASKPKFDGAAAEVTPQKPEDGELAAFDEDAKGPAADALETENLESGTRELPEDPMAGFIVEEESDVPEELAHLTGRLDTEAQAESPEPPPVPAAAAAEEPPPAPAPAAASSGAEASMPPASVFRAYDIRGVVGPEFGVEHFHALGKAVGSEAYERSQQTIVVARDGRLTSPELHAAVIAGLRETGRDVIDIGLVPTPVLYFATYYLNTGSGVMVTASHNPKDYNGLKVMLGGDTLFGDDIVALGQRVAAGNFHAGAGELQEMDLLSEYIRRVSEDVPVALGNAFRLVVDCGNGAAGVVAPKLFRALGHDVIELYCDVDGTFPNHEPDTSDPKNLAGLIAAVAEHEADLGFGFDGDGDRLAVIDSAGNNILPDRLMMLYARDILSREPGSKIVYDVKCSNRLGVIVSKLGGTPVMWKTGHSYLKNKLREEGAQLAGDLSGHIFFQERWYGFDDAMYAAARLLEILMSMKHAPVDIMSKLPSGVGTPEIRVAMPEGEHLDFMNTFSAAASFPEGDVSMIDGVRADYRDGWGLVRASNTTPALTLRFEAHNAEALARIQAEFKSQIQSVNPNLQLPF